MDTTTNCPCGTPRPSPVVPLPITHAFVIGLAANRKHRSGPTQPLPRLIQEFEPLFREVLLPRIVATGGSHRALERFGILNMYDGLESLSNGNSGIVELANQAVPPRPDPAAGQDGRPCAPEGSTRPKLDLVVYLIDPDDLTSLTPENQALKRECVVNEVPFLSTFTGAREWLILLWHELTTSGDILNQYFVDESLLARLSTQRLREPVDYLDGKPLPPHGEVLDSPERLKSTAFIPSIRGRTVALIAHDERKDCIAKFANEHRDFLSTFASRIGTGTTAERINKSYPCSPRWVEPYQSGPRGGDVQIANEILEDRCHKVVFFEDPLNPRAHEADIQLLERTARATNNDVIYAFTTIRPRRSGPGCGRTRPDQGCPTSLLLRLTGAYFQMSISFLRMNRSGWMLRRTPDLGREPAQKRLP